MTKRSARNLEILDTTLRDGAQAEGVSFTVYDKIEIVKTLDAFGVKYIEAGNPGSNPKDAAFFEEAGKLKLENARLVAFGSTHRIGVRPEDDGGVHSLLSANTPCVSIFGKCWDLHVTEILKASLEENLSCVRDTLRFFKERGKEVIFDAEHFFDGYLNNPAYAVRVLEAACEGGADVLCLCDTNGGTLPDDIRRIVETVCAAHPATRVGIHCHNDTGCAVANSLLAVEAGCDHVQGTFNGIGERCGNADLSVIIPDIQLKMGLRCVSGDMEGLQKTAARVADISGQGGQDGTGGLSPDFAVQVKQAYANLGAALDALGAKPDQVAKLTVFVVDHDMSKLDVLTRNVKQVFGDRLRAQTLDWPNFFHTFPITQPMSRSLRCVSARAKMTRCCSPPESVEKFLSSKP